MNGVSTTMIPVFAILYMLPTVGVPQEAVQPSVIHVDSLKPGAKEVSGFISNVSNAQVSVRVLQQSSSGKTVEVDKVVQPSPDGRFGMTLRIELRTADTVEVSAKVGGKTVGPEIFRVETPLDAADWGRVRGLFSFGVIVSQDVELSDSIQSTIKNSDLYFDFHVASTWRRPSVTTSAVPDGKGRQVRGRIAQTDVGFKFTSTPVIVKVPEQEGGSPAVEAIASRNAIAVDGNFAMTWPLTSWVHQEKSQTLAIGPFGQIEFRHLTANDEDSILLSSKKGSNFFPGFAGGIRMAHFAVPESSDLGVELLSHMDIGLAGLSYMNRDLDEDGVNLKRPLRFYFAGRLRIPALPLELGAEGNWALQKEGGAAAFNDLRVFFATRFDIGQVLTAVGARRSP